MKNSANTVYAFEIYEDRLLVKASKAHMLTQKVNTVSFKLYGFAVLRTVLMHFQTKSVRNSAKLMNYGVIWYNTDGQETASQVSSPVASIHQYFFLQISLSVVVADMLMHRTAYFGFPPLC